METQQNNHVLTAINAVMLSFAQQAVEQATSQLLKRITTLEQQQDELYDIIKISLKGHVNNAVKHALESPEHLIWISTLNGNVLDEVDIKIEAAIKTIPASNIEGLSGAIDESIQNQPPLDADDINGLEKFVRDMIDDLSDGGSDGDDVVRSQVRDALRSAADSL